jgi:hypothetical protein
MNENMSSGVGEGQVVESRVLGALVYEAVRRDQELGIWPTTGEVYGDVCQRLIKMGKKIPSRSSVLRQLKAMETFGLLKMYGAGRATLLWGLS